jgi:hypothetical protein
VARVSVSRTDDPLRDERWHAWERGMRAREARVRLRSQRSAALLVLVLWLLLLIR